MNKQPEALRLADELEFHGRYGYEAEDAAAKRRVKRNTESATELRRLVAENQALNDALQYSMGCHREMSELAVRQRVRLDELEQLQPKREPQFDAMSVEQERLAVQFCAEIAGRRGGKPSLPDSVRLLEMAEALYRAEVNLI